MFEPSDTIYDEFAHKLHALCAEYGLRFSIESTVPEAFAAVISVLTCELSGAVVNCGLDQAIAIDALREAFLLAEAERDRETVLPS